MKTLDIGYINENNQKNLGYRGKSDTHYNQSFYEMECLDCGHKYLANGCDVWLRKCPVCQTKTKSKAVGSSKTVSSSRAISDKLRYQVLKRDNFKCCACGASPAKDPSVELHIDHIIPWSRGGKTTADNLQTLCSRCNLGKSNDL
ncbi:MAG: HNH endonuclease [Ruminococcaceae bacterium]|nr:HNH endonuclease [Oscillospiraceae bacterium]